MKKCFVFLFLLSIVFSLGSLENAFAMPVVSIENDSVLPGGTTTIDVTISGILPGDNIDNFSFNVLYNSTALSASNAVFGPGIPSIFPPTINPGTGTVGYIVFPALLTFLSDGVIAQFDLTDIAGNNTLYPLTFSATGFAFGSGITPVPVTTVAGSLSVVPIPGSIILLGSGLLGLVGLARRRKS